MYYFVVNPVSGCGKGKKIWNTIKKELDQLSVEYEAFLLRQKGEAPLPPHFPRLRSRLRS